jgi:putative two-component system response regulator
LVEIYRGLHDQGVTRGLAALEKARAVKPALRDTLLAMIQGYERAGRADKALSLHRELTMHIRRAQHDSIVRHQEAHIRRLELGLEDVFPEAVLSDKDKELQLKLAAQTAGLKQGDLLEQMAFTAEMRDDPSGEHVYRVAKLARLLAEAHGQEPAWCEDLELAARLHDIGKVAIPDTVMKKTTPLTDGERAIVQTHTSTGADLLAKSKMSYAELAEDVARHHHERWDGGGYPEGISGTAIPLGARIVALADVYDALTHEKTYRAAWSSDQALAEIEKNTETQFDPALAGLFVPLVRELLAQYGDHAALDAWLGAAAKDSAISQARARIARSLEQPVHPPSARRPPLAHPA